MINVAAREESCLGGDRNVMVLAAVIMVPIIELYLLIAAGRVLGMGGILILLLATAFLGACF